MGQTEVDRILKIGIICSLLWLAGLGSAYSVVSGLKAKKQIIASNNKLVGIGRAWWCIIIGGLGVAVWLPIVLIGIANQF